MLSHRNLLVAAKTSGLLRNSGPADRIYGVLPMSHIVGYSILLIATLMHGATLHVVAKPILPRWPKPSPKTGSPRFTGCPPPISVCSNTRP